MEPNRSDRIQGALLGLLAGDKIGGPSRMALELADNLLAVGEFDPADVVVRYRAWYDRDGFDTGQVAAMVFRKLETMSNEDAVQDVDDYLGGLTAGCNPAHRALPLALASFIDDQSLFGIAETEARLTHHHPLAGEVSGTFLAIVRACIAGKDDDAFSMGNSSAELQRILTSKKDCSLSPSGFAPEVLRAAIHFAGRTQTFDDALDSAVLFARRENYCPVLVGAIAGARWGYHAIDQRHLSHCSAKHFGRAVKISKQLADTWDLS
jgi:ADP-ribosyl-[dinitrogen reductase] hydrolase